MHLHGIEEEHPDGKTIIKNIITDETKPLGDTMRHPIEITAKYNKNETVSDYLKDEYLLSEDRLSDKKIFVLSKNQTGSFESALNVISGGTTLRNNYVVLGTDFINNNFASGVIKSDDRLFIVLAKEKKYFKIDLMFFCKKYGLNYSQRRIFKNKIKSKL